MILKNNCKHFPGDRPCKPHKQTGITCDHCTLYEPVDFKILLIKLDALGDVLRTTAILHQLKKKYPHAYITWLTKKNAKDIFVNNSFVDEVFIFEDPSSLLRIGIESYHIVINLDPSPVSATLATTAKATQKIGFGLHENGKVYPFNKDAEFWFEMGAFDHLKKANQQTYQQVIHSICNLPYQKDEIIINLTDAEVSFKNRFIEQHNLHKFDFIVGINAGASERWQFKKWRDEGFIELIEKLQFNHNCAVLLYGGEGEAQLNKLLSEVGTTTFDTGSKNSLRDFFALMDICDVLVTGDTLALHVATALKKQVVCLFGPTSYNEIEDYGRITKVKSDLGCLVCYKMTCDYMPNCMSEISSDMVYTAVKEALPLHGKQMYKSNLSL